MEEILSEMSFDEGIAMPVANAENKQLESQLDEKQRNIVQYREDLDRLLERIQSMSSHLKNVKQERLQTQEICNARSRELKSEEHLRQLAEREEGRLRMEIQKLEKELDSIKERKNMYENNIFKGNEKIEHMKGQMNWDQQALNAWLKESAKQDDDALILQKYTKSDEGKIKELSLKQEKLIEEKNTKRKALEHEITQTLTTQLELDKISEAFRDAHKARQELLQQWEATIQQMQKRDQEMDQTSLELLELKNEVKSRREGLKESQQFLEREKSNNEEKEKKISATERQAAKLRLQYQSMENDRQQLHDELETLKYTVERTGKELDSSRHNLGSVKKEAVLKREKLEVAIQTKKELSEQLRIAESTTMSAEEKISMLETSLKKEEKKIIELDKELTRLRETQFKKKEELHQVKKLETNTNAEIQGAKAAARNLSSRLYKLDQESLKQQEIIYNQDFQLQQLERKMARLQGERSSEENKQLEAKIKQLSDTLETHKSRHNILTSQLKKLSDDLRRATRQLNAGAEEKENLTNKIGELSLHNDSSERVLKNLTSVKQELMVDENILKLEINRLKDQLQHRADEVLSLEERRLLLETAMKERRHEINIHTDMLKAQMKTSEEERQKISAELHERISKIEKLRKRYEILMVSMAPPEGEEEKSQAYFVIKAAQEKEELQRFGDELDAKIRKAEKEIRALENTVMLINNRNETYRKSLSSVEETSEEFEEKKILEDQLKIALDKCKYKRKQLVELKEDLKTMETTSETLTLDEQELLQNIEEQQKVLNVLEKELDVQEEKKGRAKKKIQKLKREVRSAQNVKSPLPEESDIEVRGMREFNKNIVNQMALIVRENPAFTPIINLYFSQAGLPIPSASVTPGSGRPPSAISSTRSSVYSGRSVRSSFSDGGSSAGSGRQPLSTTSLQLALDGLSGKTATPTGTPPRIKSRQSTPSRTPVRAPSSSGSSPGKLSRQPIRTPPSSAGKKK